MINFDQVLKASLVNVTLRKVTKLVFDPSTLKSDQQEISLCYLNTFSRKKHGRKKNINQVIVWFNNNFSELTLSEMYGK